MPQSARQSSRLCAGGTEGAATAVREREVPDVQSPIEAPKVTGRSAEGQLQLVSLGWALRRTALLLAIIAVMVVFGAWLFYASIDSDEASAAGAEPAAERT